MIVNEHENVFPNDQLLSLLDDSLLEIELILPSKSLAWLKVGTPFEYAVDETGLRYPAAVQDIGANVDPASQTVKVKRPVSHPARKRAGGDERDSLVG